MEFSNWDLFWNSVAMGLGTWFWMWYLIWEYEVAKGIRKINTSWWNTDLLELVRRKQ